MATLSEKKRDSMPDSKFGLPDEHKYPCRTNHTPGMPRRGLLSR